MMKKLTQLLRRSAIAKLFLFSNALTPHRRLNSYNLALFFLLPVFLSSCVNPFFERLLKEKPEEIEIEASLSWRNDWIAEAQGLDRDTDNEFASVPGNPLKAVPTAFFQDSFESIAHTGATTVYRAQKWESAGTSPDRAAFVIYYRIPGVASYDSATENLYFRVSRDGGANWGTWAWAVDSTADSGWFEIKDGCLFFKTGVNFAEDNSGWAKLGDYFTVEIALFETPKVAPTGQDRTDILSVRKRLKQRTFTVDLSGVTFDPSTGFTVSP
jgi:hypothetical protein